MRKHNSICGTTSKSVIKMFDRKCGTLTLLSTEAQRFSLLSAVPSIVNSTSRKTIRKPTLFFEVAHLVGTSYTTLWCCLCLLFDISFFLALWEFYKKAWHVNYDLHEYSNLRGIFSRRHKQYMSRGKYCRVKVRICQTDWQKLK